MTDFNVSCIRINRVEPHPNADRLELVFVEGWQCVVSKGSFKVGDVGLYIPIDAVLPRDVELMIFPPDSKVKLHQSRVRTIKLRGHISQGLLVKPEEVGIKEPFMCADWGPELGIVKYEPKTPDVRSQYGLMKPKRHRNEHFKEYTDISNYKNHPTVFEERDIVVVTEKVHGTNFRAGWLPRTRNSWWQKIVAYFQPWEFCYGSRRVQLQRKMLYNGFYSTNVYGKIVRQYALETRIPKGYVVYGEIYGDGIQKGYTYGCPAGEHKLAVFDVTHVEEDDPPGTIAQRYLDYTEFHLFCKAYDFPRVPVLWSGFAIASVLNSLADGPSELWRQEIREGIVIKPLKEAFDGSIGRKILKRISDDYLLRDQSDNH